jgi:hypothetical protein
VIRPSSPSEAEEIFRAYEAVAGKPEARNGGLCFADPNNGPVTLIRKDDLLFGIVNAPDDSAEARVISLIRPQAR